MPLDLSPASLAKEVESAIEFRNSHLVAFEEITRRQIGKFFRKSGAGSGEEGADYPENDVHTYKAFMLPELCFGTPSARVTAKRPSLHEEIAEGLDAALESWIAESGFTEELQIAVDDTLSGWAIVHVGLEPVEEGGEAAAEGRLTVYACAIEARRFLIDKTRERSRYARFWGHEYDRSIEWVLNNPRLDPQLAQKLIDAAGDKEDPDNPSGLDPAKGNQGGPQSKLVHLVDLYLTETRQICTLAMIEGNVQPTFVRQPTAYWGPKSGPYELFGIYRVAGSPIPLGPIQPWLDQSQEKNAHLAAAATEAGTAKTIFIGDGSNPELGDALLNAKHLEFRTVKGFSASNFTKVETGAMSNNRLEYITTVQERMDRTAGFSDAQRGRAAKATATESQIVESNADIKVEWMRMRIVLHTKAVLWKVLWYMIHDPNFVQPVSRFDPVMGQTMEGVFLGGPQMGQEEVDEGDFELTLDPQSMQRSDDVALQQRYFQLLDAFPKFVAMQQSGGNARWLADRLGSTMNEPRLSEVLWPPGSIGMIPGLVPPGAQGQLPNQQGGLPNAGPPVNANLSPAPDPNGASRIANSSGAQNASFRQPAPVAGYAA